MSSKVDVNFTGLIGAKFDDSPLSPPYAETLLPPSCAVTSQNFYSTTGPPNGTSAVETVPTSPSHGYSSVTPQFEPQKTQERKQFRITEHQGAEIAIQTLGIRRIDNLLYYHSGPYLRRLTREALLHEASRILYPVISEKGTLDYLQRVCKLVKYSPRLQQNELSRHDLIGFANGVLNIQSWTFTQRIFPAPPITTNIQANYYPSAIPACPIFDTYLSTVTGGDELLIERIWQALGYLLTPDHSARVCILLQGLSGSGKSVFCDFVNGCFPVEDVTTVDLYELTNSTARSQIVGKKLLLNTEIADAPLTPKTTKILKQLTGGDLLHADHPDGKEHLDFRNTTKILFASNHILQMHRFDEALYRRIVVIPFEYVAEHPDFELHQKLAEERDAIVSRAMRHYKDLVACGYLFAGEYNLNDVALTPQQSSSIITTFLEDECVIDPKGWTSTADLYHRFCEVFDHDHSMATFSELLQIECTRLKYPVSRKRPRKGTKNPIRGFQGLSLKEDL